MAALRIREDYRTLTGPEKAAIMMLALGEEHATKLFTHMDDEEIRELSQTMANLGTVSSTIIERLFVEFAEQISSTGSLVGTYESTERLLHEGAGQRQSQPDHGGYPWSGRPHHVGQARQRERDGARQLPEERIPADRRGGAVEDQGRARGPRPGPVAGKLRAWKSSCACCAWKSVQKEVLDDVERTLRTEFMSNLARTSRRDAHEMMAEIFNNLDRNTESRFLAALEERNRDSAERIKALMFTFEDLSKLDPSGVQTLLRVVDKPKLGLALKGASETLRDLFFTNMSERAAKIMREDMAAMGPVRLRDVDEAQMYMVQVAKDLAARGEIVMAEGKGEDELIY